MKLLKITLLLLLLSLNIKADMTFFATKANPWNSLQKFEKFVYIVGLMDGAILGDMQIQGVDISTKLNAEQYVNRIDTFYADKRNMNIPVPYILKVISLEQSQVSQITIQKVIFDLREENNQI